jgi:hypothetical protein
VHAPDLDHYRRLRRRAVVWTSMLAPVLALHVVQFVVYLVDKDPRGAWIVFQGGILGILAGFWLGHVWSRARRAKPPRPDADGRGAVRGGPELEGITLGHLSITGQESAPTRW